MRNFLTAPVGLGLLLLTGCGGGMEQVNPTTIAAAKAKWEKAGLKDYNLDWSTSGERNARYRVFVRGGEVKAIYTVRPDGREIVSKPGQPRFYSVEGLFTTIEDEIAQLDQPRPFNQPKGSAYVLKFDPDPELGYPRAYQRDVLGSPHGIAIRVDRLDRSPPSEIPPPLTEAPGSSGG